MILSFYLTQYHPIPENDKWWGTGFTEWTNVKKSKPLFPGHNQPEIPLDYNYYDLEDSSVMVSQAEMAKKYGIDGFVFYHYWFEGRKLLEKPIEKMLENQRVDIPFCLCWANETWSRTWDGKDTDILIEQNYDERPEAWIEHYAYLREFFKDQRYIKHNGCPMLIIYKPQLMKRCQEMIDCWRNLCQEDGFSGLYIGFQHYSAYDYGISKPIFDFGITFEPWFTIMRRDENRRENLDLSVASLKWILRKFANKFFHLPFLYSYNGIWKSIIKRNTNSGKKLVDIMPCAFTSWDNTPRRGGDGAVFVGSSPKRFYKYFKKMLAKYIDSEYIFINAWNEWGEGAHLEPDEKNKYGYLEAVKKAREEIVV